MSAQRDMSPPALSRPSWGVRSASSVLVSPSAHEDSSGTYTVDTMKRCSPRPGAGKAPQPGCPQHPAEGGEGLGVTLQSTVPRLVCCRWQGGHRPQMPSLPARSMPSPRTRSLPYTPIPVFLLHGPVFSAWSQGGLCTDALVSIREEN